MWKNMRNGRGWKLDNAHVSGLQIYHGTPQSRRLQILLWVVQQGKAPWHGANPALNQVSNRQMIVARALWLLPQTIGLILPVLYRLSPPPVIFTIFCFGT